MQSLHFLHPETANDILAYCRKENGDPEQIAMAVQSFDEILKYCKTHDDFPEDFSIPNLQVYLFLFHCLMSLIQKNSN